MENDPEKLSMARRRQATSLTLAYLRQTGKWSKIYPFLMEKGYVIEGSADDEQKSKRCLLDQDTTIIAMLIYLAFSSKKPSYTVGSLAKALDNSSHNAKKAMERKVSRLLISIAGYQIIDFYKDTHKGDRECIRIEATDLLIEFIEQHFFDLWGVITMCTHHRSLLSGLLLTLLLVLSTASRAGIDTDSLDEHLNETYGCSTTSTLSNSG